MHKATVVFTCMFAALCALSGSASADRDHDRDRGHEQGRDYDRERGYEHRRDHDSDYGRYQGYREQPYGHERRFDQYSHDDHRYDYRGHWRSWDAWNDYARHHPRIREHGHYYRDHGHLMFRFCDPASGGCFFFSIGG